MQLGRADPRPYELVLFGASGVTGQYCAEHIAQHMPTDLRWAVAGRSALKLQQVVDSIRSLNPDRKQPGTEIVNLDEVELESLALKTKLLVNCVGPYSLYGEPVLAACAKNGTNYVDTTGEVPWVQKMIARYHATARSTGAILIPQCGFESAVSDMLVFEALTGVRERFKTGAAHVAGCVYRSRMQASGGTLSTIFTLFDVFSTRELLAAQKPFVLSPVARTAPATVRQGGIVGRLTSTFVHPVLGPQAIWLMGSSNMAIVQRTWGLLDGGIYYGQRFTYSETMRVPSRLIALTINVVLALASILITIPPVRWVVRRLVRQPGIGPDRESDKKSFCDLRAVAEADDGSGRRVLSRLAWNGSVYHLTAVLMIEAAITLLRDRDTKAREIGGGILTPATLGVSYADRLRAAGVTLEEREL